MFFDFFCKDFIQLATNYQKPSAKSMVPSFKFTLIAWMVIIGLGSLSALFKQNKSNSRSHSSNPRKGFTFIKPFKAESFYNYPSSDKLIIVAEGKQNLPVYLLRSSNNDHHLSNQKFNDKILTLPALFVCKVITV